MANVTIAGATYSDVPAIQVPSGSGTALFYETKDVTYNLTGGASASVTPSEVVAGQGFSLKLKAPAGYNLNGVTVTMGGVDITSQVFTPDEAGGGGSAELGTKTITLNGTYNAEDDELDGYSSVTVNVNASPNLQSKSATYTPTASTQTATITADNNYDGLSNVSITVDPSTLMLKTLRPDAELIQTYSGDSLVVTDDKVTLPSYNSSKAVTIKASGNLSGTVTLDYTNYNYFVVERFLTTPVYNTATPVASRNEFSVGSVMYELVDIPANSFKAANGTLYASQSVGMGAYTVYRLLYWSSASAVGVYTSTTYGIQQVAAAPSISSGKLTLKYPTLQFRGSTTYLTSAVYDTITDIRRQFVINVYRAPKNNLNIDGWGLTQNALSILNDVKNNNGTLR